MASLDRALRVGCVGALALAAACQGADTARIDSPPALGVAPSDSVGSRPVSNYKDERVRLALLGLDYASGRPLASADAGDVVAGLDARDVPALLEAGHAQLGRNEKLEAIGSFTRAVLLSPQAAPLEALGDALRMERFEARSEAAYRAALDLEPDSAQLHHKLSEVLWMGPRSEEALSEAREAVRLAPEHGPAQRNLALWSYYAGDDASAWSATQRAEDLGQAVPPQFRALLSARTPEPPRAR